MYDMIYLFIGDTSICTSFSAFCDKFPDTVVYFQMNLAIYDWINAAVGVKEKLSYCPNVVVCTFMNSSARIYEEIIDCTLH